VQNPWRRAGAIYGTVALLVIMTVVAALLVAGITLPLVGITGIATRDAADTFNNLQVGALGTPPARSAMYDSEGQVIAYFYPNNVYRVPVSYNQIAPVMRNAIVAIEDNTFYNEGALDFRGTVRAMVSDAEGSETQGGSTLAQQYVKNVRLLLAKNLAEQQEAINETVVRKIQELRIAAHVEQEMTPDQLLAAYLNVAYFDNHAWGIQVASEVYFSVPASKLTLPEAALLAGIVQSPTAYDPVANPTAATQRRNEVLTRMAQLHYITQAQATAAMSSKIKLKMSSAPLETGCSSPQAKVAGFFCDYVQHVLEVNYPSIWSEIQTTGGLQIHTTLNMHDQIAADRAVDYVLPQYSSTYNPNHDADTDVLIQPGSGAVRAIAINRIFGYGSGHDSIDYAVDSEYGGDINGVQTGSSSKLFTLITALKQGYAFGTKIKVVSPTTVYGYTNCEHQPLLTGFPVTNSEGPTEKGGVIWQLYSATVDSINVYFAHLEEQVGLCNVVKTAVDMGMTRADGGSLMKGEGKPGTAGYQYPADDVTSFTLGSVGVSPMSMAAAYASVAARGMYCPPDPLTKIVDGNGHSVALQPNKCHRDMSKGVADAANYILSGVLTQSGATADGRGTRSDEAAKTGTANGGYFAAFAGYTPTLAGYVSVFNPYDPTTGGAMVGVPDSCYRYYPGGYQSCPGQMYGDDAPGSTWEFTFAHAQLGPDIPFVSPPSSFFVLGPGNGPPTPVNPPKKKKPGGPPGHGGPPPPTPPTQPTVAPTH
jgi:membrane peptidoglycan carboxypeptidase